MRRGENNGKFGKMRNKRGRKEKMMRMEVDDERRKRRQEIRVTLKRATGT